MTGIDFFSKWKSNSARLRPPFWFYNPQLSARKTISFLVLLHLFWLTFVYFKSKTWSIKAYRKHFSRFYHPNVLTLLHENTPSASRVAISRKNSGSYMTGWIFSNISAGCDALISLAILLKVSVSLCLEKTNCFIFTFNYFLGFALLITNQHYYITNRRGKWFWIQDLRTF